MFGKKKIAMQATIVADEGYTFVSKGNGPKGEKQHETYIIEVHPDGEAPFRTEVKAWVSWPMPQVGDAVPVLREPGTHKVELNLKGDPRFDSKLRKQQQKQADGARRDELLNSPVLSQQPTGTAGTVARSQEQDATVCLSCGQPHGPGEAYCPHCGHRLV